MDYRTYQKLRAYCMLDLSMYMDIPEHKAVMRVWVKLNGEIGRIEREQQLAHSLFQCHDLTPREVAAAELLAVASNHRAITWQREPSPPNGRAPAPPLDASTADRLSRQTRAAVSGYAAFLPEPERTALLADCEPEQTQHAPTLSTTTAAPQGSNQISALEQRFVRFKAGGGSSKYTGGDWHFKGIKKFVESEVTDGHKRSSEKTVRDDLKEAAQAERDTNSAKPFDGLAGRK